MAPIPKLIPFLFLTTLLFSLQLNARESQFFSKVTPLNNNLKETELTDNEGSLNKPEQQQPVFIPQTENSYGLFKKDAYNTNQNELSETRLTGTSFNNYFYSGKDAFEKQNEFSDTKFAEGGYSSMENQNNNNNNNHNAANERFYYNNNNNDASNNRYYKTKAVNNNYNGERQGLSDTRFVEGGKYYYDLNSEKYNNPTQYGGSSRGVNSEQWYNNRGNSMEGYQNQEQFEDDQEEFEP
ncbi:hypothetical protein V8G54_003949 [Vigna mungo]|uniref:Protein E6 n=1 Tax=Vigna mungo TaxID=3915 RepID=A0AAQ3PD91_VIGMU